MSCRNNCCSKIFGHARFTGCRSPPSQRHAFPSSTHIRTRYTQKRRQSWINGCAPWMNLELKRRSCLRGQPEKSLKRSSPFTENTRIAFPCGADWITRISINLVSKQMQSRLWSVATRAELKVWANLATKEAD